FGLAERATDWRGNNNIAESILRQLAAEPDPQPEWIVCGVGTGGTSATIGRYLRYRGWPTRLCVAEPSGAAFAQAYQAGGRRDALASRATIIEGVGRARVEPGFQFEIVDRVEEIDDADSVIGMRDLEALLGRRYGGSSGCNWIACLRLAAELRQRGLGGSIVTLLGDSGERYADTLYDNAWLRQRGHDLMSAQKRLSDLKSAH
ncbi:MAG: pyridoxal-phosphate dependent enzyme, partial [Xanthomonadales bacterium]|nr:pyridoxal-phosphate dependent enzyme [Xanthomonadales bacterium]